MLDYELMHRLQGGCIICHLNAFFAKAGFSGTFNGKALINRVGLLAEYPILLLQLLLNNFVNANICFIWCACMTTLLYLTLQENDIFDTKKEKSIVILKL